MANCNFHCFHCISFKLTFLRCSVLRFVTFNNVSTVVCTSNFKPVAGFFYFQSPIMPKVHFSLFPQQISKLYSTSLFERFYFTNSERMRFDFDILYPKISCKLANFLPRNVSYSWIQIFITKLW